MAQDITSVKINELATSAISSSDYFVKADANGIAYKNTLSALASFIGSVGVSGYRGVLAIADTPTEDGFYFASESGTYTNAGGLVVDLANGINIISVTGTQTVFDLAVIPVDLSGQLDNVLNPENTDRGVTGKAVYDFTDKNTNSLLDSRKGEKTPLLLNSLGYNFPVVDVWTESGLTEGFILGSSGDPTAFATGAISGYMNVEGYNYIQINGFSGFSDLTTYGYLTFYNSAQEKIAVTNTNALKNGEPFDVTGYAGLVYIRLTAYAYGESIQGVSIYAFDEIPKVNEIAGKQIDALSYTNSVIKYNSDLKNEIDFDSLNTGVALSSAGAYFNLPDGIISNKITLPPDATYIMIKGNEQVTFEKRSAYLVFKAINNVVLSVQSYGSGLRNGKLFKIPQPNPDFPTTYVELTLRTTDEAINDCGIFLLPNADEKILSTYGATFGDSFDYEVNGVLLPSEVWGLTDDPIQIFQSGMFREYGKEKEVDVSLNYTDAGRYYTRKILEALEVSTDATGKFLIRQTDLFNKVLYKEVTINVVDPSTVSGSISWMAIGDSLTEGNGGNDVSPLYQATQLLATYGVTVDDFGTYRTTSKEISLEYEGRGGWRYRTFVGLESKYAGLPLSLPASTTSNDVPKNENPFLYVATEQDRINYPEWCFNFVVGDTYNVSYAENPNLGTYYIFNPEAYFVNRFAGVRPDVISIALGTNEWYVQQNIYNGFDLPKIKESIEWMISRLRAAAPTSKIIVIPYHQIGFVRKLTWEDYAFHLAQSANKIVEDMREAGDADIHTLPLYCMDDPYSTIRNIVDPADISDDSNIQIGGSSDNVHTLDQIAGNPLDVYKRGLTNCILNIM